MLPDLCLIGQDDNAGTGGIGQPAGVGGGVGTTGTITPNDGVSYPGTIGDKPCNRPVISGVTGMKRVYIIQLKHSNGVPIDLTNIPTVKFYAKETVDAVSYYLERTCTVVDPVQGMIRLSLRYTDIPYAGVWLAAFHLIDVHNNPVAQFDVYLYIEKSLTSGEQANNPITIPEVRLSLLDRCPADNSLLDDLEFSDAEIAFAIRRPVDEWNEIPPPIYNAMYTPATFPFHYHWLEAACAELLRMASRKLIRNKLDYNAGGVQVQDKSRAAVYAQLSEQIHQQYLAWAQHEKASINAGNVYGSIRTVTYY